MRGHDTYFPQLREIGIMSPYSAVCLIRFVMPPEAAFMDCRKNVGGRVAERFCAGSEASFGRLCASTC